MIEMDQRTLELALGGLPLAEIRFLESTGSTNDVAAVWADDGALNGSLIVADEQTAGRGRFNRRWFTPSGTALAFSLILRPSLQEQENVALFSPLSALAIAVTLENIYNLHPEIKWPNDVLLDHKKVGGILVESYWDYRQPAIVVGCGINLAPGSVPPSSELLFPAVCLEEMIGKKINREKVLAAILTAFFEWRPLMGSPDFLKGWWSRLAFKNQIVRISQDGQSDLEGILKNIDENGRLELSKPDGSLEWVQVGDVHLQPGSQL